MKQIPLTQGKVALVDDDLWEWLSQRKWQAIANAGGQYYAMRSKRTSSGKVWVSMSRVILGLTDPHTLAEHKNGDTLDNRRKNLRPSTGSQNQANREKQKNNTSGAKSIRYYPGRSKPWTAYIRIDRKQQHLGQFATQEEAMAAYHQKAVEVWGEFAQQRSVNGQADY